MKKIFIVPFFLLFIFSCSDKREKIGQNIHMKIIQYQKSKGHLPDKLNDIGIEEKWKGRFIIKNRQTQHLLYTMAEDLENLWYLTLKQKNGIQTDNSTKEKYLCEETESRRSNLIKLFNDCFAILRTSRNDIK